MISTARIVAVHFRALRVPPGGFTFITLNHCYLIVDIKFWCFKKDDGLMLWNIIT